MKHCRCGHSRVIHASGRYACMIRFNRYPLRGMHGQTPSQRDCRCEHYREARWLDDHNPLRHLAVWLWWKVPVRAAWRIADLWWNLRRRRVCWCEIVDSVRPIYDPSYRSDYAGFSCLCDAPLPFDARPPIPGWCYCPTPEEIEDGAR